MGLIAYRELAAERLHGDNAPMPVLAEDKADTSRTGVNVHGTARLGSPKPAALLFRQSWNRSGNHLIKHLRGFTTFPY